MNSDGSGWALAIQKTPVWLKFCRRGISNCTTTQRVAIGKARSEGRYKIMSLSYQDLMTIFSRNDYAIFAVQHRDIPSDCHVDEVHLSPESRSWLVRLVHPSFDRVEPGTRIPEINGLGEVVVKTSPLVLKYPWGNCLAAGEAKQKADEITKKTGREVITLPDSMSLERAEEVSPQQLASAV